MAKGLLGQLMADFAFYHNGGFVGAEEMTAEQAARIDYLHEQIDTMYNEIYPFARDADERYYALIYEQLEKVPAVQKYDGSYVEKLEALLVEGDMDVGTEGHLEKIISQLKSEATQIQTFLNEETSELEAAKLWDSKFVKALHEHIPPHARKEEGEFDDVMSDVMQSFRMFMESEYANVQAYGSQNLINATYEAVEEGKDAFDYMYEILQINYEQNNEWSGFNEQITVPYAGFGLFDFFF